MNFYCSGVNGSIIRSFPCWNGGTCSFSTINGFSCTCPTGYTHDFVGFGHFLNCSLPVRALDVFFIVYSLLFFLGLFFSILKLYQTTKNERMKKKGKLKTLIKIGLLWCCTGWIHVLSVFLEKGFFDASVITFSLLSIVGYIVAGFAIQIIFEPLSKRAGLLALSKRIKCYVWSIISFQICCIIVLNSLGLSHCRDSDPTWYNLFSLIQLFEQCLAVLFCSILIFSGSIRLRVLLPKQAGKLQNQILCLIFFSFFLASSGFLLFIALLFWALYHSLPMAWLCWMLTSCALLVGVYLTVPLFDSFIVNNNSNISLSHHPQGLVEGEQYYHQQLPPSAYLVSYQQGNSESTSMSSSSANGLLSLSKRKRRRLKIPKLLSRITEYDEATESQQRIGSQYPSLHE